MITKNDFVTVLDEELGLDVTLTDLDQDFDELPEWDSLQLLRMVGVIESRTRTRVPVSELLKVRTLAAVYDLYVQVVPGD